MDIIDRLQEIIDYAGLNVSSFAKKIGVVDQTIRGIVVQRRNTIPWSPSKHWPR